MPGFQRKELETFRENFFRWAVMVAARADRLAVSGANWSMVLFAAPGQKE